MREKECCNMKETQGRIKMRKINYKGTIAYRAKGKRTCYKMLIENLKE